MEKLPFHVVGEGHLLPNTRIPFEDSNVLTFTLGLHASALSISHLRDGHKVSLIFSYDA